MKTQKLNKQSSIEWLTQQALQWNIDKNDGSHYIKFPSNAFEQAKAMHKEEIEAAYEEGMLNDIYGITPKKYYNETYGDKKVK